MYIDPSAGSLILQLLAAGVVAAAATWTRLRVAVASFVRGLLGKREPRH